ncbi:hypothetical protein SAMN05421874_12870 [Nonomuraea maritima]|uniref:Uncharacterized protein n=1 Tax=Nonomuraea maritima TaxID=683260 RepID=A0A1G9MLJ6_9ACTN|nr:hypothetical protein [Nonomuraea maritima]SDL74525.1 hypothetical protein SAMN05421874_12870 [Nonomuraea maritima]
MSRLVAFLVMVAVTCGASWITYQDSKPGGVLIFLVCMVGFVAAPYFRLMGLTKDDDKPRT